MVPKAIAQPRVQLLASRTDLSNLAIVASSLTAKHGLLFNQSDVVRHLLSEAADLVVRRAQ